MKVSSQSYVQILASHSICMGDTRKWEQFDVIQNLNSKRQFSSHIFPFDRMCQLFCLSGSLALLLSQDGKQKKPNFLHKLISLFTTEEEKWLAHDLAMKGLLLGLGMYH